MRAIFFAGVLLALAALGIYTGWSGAAPQSTVTGGDPVYRSGSFIMRLTGEECPFEELDTDLTNRGIPPVKAYRTLTKDGRWAMPGCWAKDMGGDILTVDTAGGEGFIPKDWLTH
jgi:hypothetical protein